MMKGYWLCLLLSITAVFAGRAQTAPDIPVAVNSEAMELKGKVLLVQEKKFVYKDGEPEEVVARQTGFDTSGRINMLQLSPAGKTAGSTTYYVYNDAGQIQSESIKGATAGYDSVAYVYNHAVELRQKLMFDGGKRHGTWRYNYRNGKLSYIRIEDGHNRLLNMIRYRYKSDNEYQRSVFNETLNFSSAELYMEDTDTSGMRQWLCYFYATEDSCSGMMTRNYNAGGKLTEEVITGSDKRVQQYSSYTYNEQGLADQQIIFTDEKQTIGYTYRLDAQGNWLERTAYAGGKALETTARMIDYYKDDNKNAARAGGIKVLQED